MNGFFKTSFSADVGLVILFYQLQFFRIICLSVSILQSFKFHPFLL